MHTGVLVAVEGDTDVPFARRVVGAAGVDVARVMVLNGHGNLDKHVRRWCQPSNRQPMLVLRDYQPSGDAACVVALRARLSGPAPHSPSTLVRIAEHEIEAWALADREGIAEFFHVRPAAVPATPDGEPDPKRLLVDLCRRSSSRRIRRAMVPGAASGRKVGPQFTGLMLDFGSSVWNVARAREVSPSLDRAVRSVESLSSGA